MGYRIKTVARLTGIPRNTLLAWERRYQLVDPDRSDNGYREYSDEDVDLLRAIKRLVDDGYKISEAITLVKEGGLEQPHTRETEIDVATLDHLRDEMKRALLQFDRSEALRLVSKAPMTSYVQQLNALYLPLLADVGDGWERGQISIAQEHFASAFVRERMLSMLVTLEHGPDGGRRVLCAGIAGDRHEGGLLAFAIQLAMAGWRVGYLGADVPWTDLAAAARQQNAELICISAIVAEDRAALVRYARNLRGAASKSTDIVIGGAAVKRHADELPEVDGVTWQPSAHAFFEAVRAS
jgi:DNA-binding transcriptional MerR regulator/methylmalonyl-CoA mutase cobalamin-binding subunit